MEAVRSSETSVYYHIAPRRHDPEDRDVNDEILFGLQLQ
jgi:hypothetical protein